MMILLPCFCGRISVLITVVFLVANASDPCGTYKSLDNPYRSTGYVAREGIDPMICDDNLKTGWYRFVNKVGGKMPETKVGRGHCGTVAPIWMQGQHPSIAEGIVTRTACVNVNNRYGGCIPISIKVKNCTDFFVYRLVAPYGCHMAYCAGTLRPCPRGQSGLFPNCKVLRKVDFPFDQVPVPNVTYIDDNEIKVTLKCDVKVPPWGNVSFEIQWFVNGKISKSAQCNDPATNQCARLRHRDYQLGSHIRCEIRAKYNTHPNNSWTQAKSSEIFYAGIEVHPTHLSVLECNASSDNRIRLRPTLPIRGDDINLSFGTDDDFQALLSSQCKITLQRGEEHEWTNVSIQAVCDNTNRIYRLASFTFTVTSTHHFWQFGHKTSPVTVAKVENPVGNCIATGDPHYTTFDGKYYDFYGPGDFVLYRNKDRAFEIHTRLWTCWGVTCNCGVAIREKHDVIVLTTCTQNLQLTYGMPMKVLITSQRRLTRGTKIFARHPGSYSEYVVILPSGTVVRITRYSWGNNVEMQAPQSDKSKTEGMCGNFDGDPNNEFKHGGPDGDKNTGDQNSFGESWRVNRANSLFHIVPNCNEVACNTEELDMDRCQCQKKSTGQMSITCNLQLMQFNSVGGEGNDITGEVEGNTRKKRDLVYSDDITYLYDDEEPTINIPHDRSRRAVNTKMSLENATEYCRNAILNSAAAKVCLEISGVNASNAIEACAADLQFTGDLRWAESAFEGLKSTCEFQAVKNFSAYDKDEEGNSVPPVKIAQNLCPNDCSFNGNCTNGTCICKEGFIAEDCSMREDEIPSLFRILDKGLCDVRVRPCLKTIVFGENFLNSKNLTCHVKEFSVIPSKWLPSNETKKLNGSKTDLFAIECELPIPPMNLGNYDVEGSPAAGYIISVSNDKVHKSLQALTLITFDSICQECNVSQGCSLKKRSCLIKGHCFAEGKPNPKNWCELCNSSASQDLWSKRVVNYPPNITTPNQRYALLGEDLQLQLEGEDPEERPFVISMMSGSPPGAKLTDQGVLQWRPQSTVKEKFYFKATDECNASSTFEMSVEILTCPCTDKGVCLPDPNHPRGSGMYYCKCQPGYDGQRCEREIDECLSNPCVHGTCSDMVNNYSCQCQPGYTGYNCSFEIDECQSSPCINGSCTDMLNGFVCTCQSGFTGLRCEVNINDCPSSGCGNGTCIDLIENYTCQCNVGFAGESCNIVIRNCSNNSCFHGVRCIQLENTIACGPCPTGYTGDGKHCQDIDDCVNHTCQNRGSCVDGINNFTCNCLKGYTGSHCQTDINDCVNHTCQNGGSCVDGINNFTCNCLKGYTGSHCQTDINDCVNHACQNGGSCVDGINNFTCNCLKGYTGSHCQTDINDCVNHTCQNGGSCVDGINNFTCNCLKGYTGSHCRTDINDCVNHICQNGGSCVDGINNFTCNCLKGYTGSHCQTDINDCVNHTCLNGGSCVDDVNNYTCKCLPEFKGDRCEKNINDCVNHTCLNGGSCVDDVNNYTCRCVPGFKGDRCEKNINDCLNHTCQNGGSCVDGINNFTCNCLKGYTGSHCQKDINDCVNHTCLNGGSCVDDVNNYTCRCVPGFKGDRCEKNINDCVNHTCQNDASCGDGINNFTCNCLKGYTGSHCQTDIHDCVNHTCQNGGSCVDGINNFTCNCLKGYTGSHCQTDIDDCLNHTCLNGGSCVDGVNNYTCRCVAGFKGDRCEKNINDCVNHTCQNGGSCVDGINNFTCNCLKRYTGSYCQTDIDDCINHACLNGGSCIDDVDNYRCRCIAGFKGDRCETKLITAETSTSESTTPPSTLEENVSSQTTTKEVSFELKTEFTCEIRINEEWDDRLKDETGETFKKLSALLKEEILKVYSGNPELIEVEIVSLRPGSIIADFQLKFNTSVSADEALAPLKKEAAKGKLGILEVEPNSLKLRNTEKEEKQKEKESSSETKLPLIIGVSCGVFVVIAVFTICLVYVFKWKRTTQFGSNDGVSSDMPADECHSRREKYELEAKYSKDNELICVEVKGICNEGMD